MQQADQLHLERVVFYGRSLAEYKLFFNLDLPALEGKSVLDCPSGAASFAAEAAELGINVTAIDPLFENSVEKLRAIGEVDIDHVMDEVEKVQHAYLSRYYHSMEEMRAARRRTLDLFCADFQRRKASYVPAFLPNLPFADGQFDLVLSAHFLFIYDDRFDYPFHVAAARELARVSAGEVRLFPPAGMNRKPYPQLDQLRKELETHGIASEVIRSDFEFVQGWNQILVLRSKSRRKD
ncbi:MAG: class I SAM-dependent methyltransferase [Verrucomicrobia bacterium]|nr:class I SAM-dependent methyltransferase [Verrucomicrobiota bacterium]